MSEQEQSQMRALQIQTGLVAGSVAGLADLVFQGGWNGLAIGGVAAVLLAASVPEYADEVKESVRKAREWVAQMQEALPYVSRNPFQLMQSASIHLPTEEAVEAELQRMRTNEEIDEEGGETASLGDGASEDITDWVNDLQGDPIGSFGEKDNGIFFFSELLRTGWRPSWGQVFVGRTEKKNIFVPALDLCHVAFAGKTGGGKGSLMRLIMVQLCYIGAPVALLNPHYMRWVVAKEGEEFDEDWSPFEGTNPKTDKPYLEKSPVACAEMPMIDSCLTWAATTLYESRKQRARTQKVNFVPYFIVIDEWPEILAELGKSAAAHLGKLLRGGRKYRIYVIIASQDFQVKTMGIEGEGSIRKCLLTVFYTGGDITTRRELLNEETRETPENKIGKGVVLMRCTGTENEVVLAHVPFVDNESVYLLLGPSTFDRHGQEAHTDELEDFRLSLSPDGVSPSEHESVMTGESGESVKPPVERGESGESVVKFHQEGETVSPEDEMVIVRTAFSLIATNGKVTREEIKTALQWNNKRHSEIKVVCDKYSIAMPGGK
jgi:hypothetical protein